MPGLGPASTMGRIDDRLAELDRQLQGREWIAADRLTIADITGVVAVDFLRLVRRQIPEADDGVGASGTLRMKANGRRRR